MSSVPRASRRCGARSGDERGDVVRRASGGTVAVDIALSASLIPTTTTLHDANNFEYNLRENGVYSRMNTRTGNAHGVLHADGVSPPGYPLFLTLFMRGKPNLQFMERVILAQAALGVFSTFFAFLLARFALPPALACVVALLTALSPHLAIVSAYLLSESLFTCLLLISLWTFAQAIKSRRSWDWALAGLIFGVCCLVRPTK